MAWQRNVAWWSSSSLATPERSASSSSRREERDMTDALIDSGQVILDLDSNGVAHLRLNRPEASNGMDVPFLQALHAAIMRCHGEPAVRVVVLRGEGKHFCAGGDVKTFASKGD